jgi:hypothetical protein
MLSQLSPSLVACGHVILDECDKLLSEEFLAQVVLWFIISCFSADVFGRLMTCSQPLRTLTEGSICSGDLIISFSSVDFHTLH